MCKQIFFDPVVAWRLVNGAVGWPLLTGCAYLDVACEVQRPMIAQLLADARQRRTDLRRQSQEAARACGAHWRSCVRQQVPRTCLGPVPQWYLRSSVAVLCGAAGCIGPVPQWYLQSSLAVLCGAAGGTDLPRTCATMVFAELTGGLVWGSKCHGPASDFCHSGI